MEANARHLDTSAMLNELDTRIRTVEAQYIGKTKDLEQTVLENSAKLAEVGARYAERINALQTKEAERRSELLQVQSKISLIEAEAKKSRETSAELAERLSAISKATEIFVLTKPRLLLQNNRCKTKSVAGGYLFYLDVDIANKGSYPVNIRLIPSVTNQHGVDINSVFEIHYRDAHELSLEGMLPSRTVFELRSDNIDSVSDIVIGTVYEATIPWQYIAPLSRNLRPFFSDKEFGENSKSTFSLFCRYRCRVESGVMLCEE